MKAKGFVYEPQLETDAVGTPPLRIDQDYGVYRLEDARRYGYHDPHQLEQMRGQLAYLREHPKDPHSEAYLLAERGFGHGNTDVSAPLPPNCSDQAFEEVQTKAAGDRSEIVGRLRAQARAGTKADARVKSLERAWSACMASEGYTYGAPADALNAAWPVKVGQRETATATKDVHCKQRLDFVAVWTAVEVKQQQAAIEANRAALNQLVEDGAAALAKATNILKSGT